MTPMHAKRLLKLADFLDALPRGRFSYSTWVGKNWKGKQDLSCGTTACALGWATTMPEFRKLGLRLFPPQDGMGARVGLKNRPGTDEYDAAGEVFGLGFYDTQELFVPGDRGEDKPGDKATAKQVAKHIRRFVDEATGSSLMKGQSKP